MPVFDKCRVKDMDINLHRKLRVQETTTVLFLEVSYLTTLGIVTMIDEGMNKEN